MNQRFKDAEAEIKEVLFPFSADGGHSHEISAEELPIHVVG